MSAAGSEKNHTADWLPEKNCPAIGGPPKNSSKETGRSETEKKNVWLPEGW